MGAYAGPPARGEPGLDGFCCAAYARPATRRQTDQRICAVSPISPRCIDMYLDLPYVADDTSGLRSLHLMINALIYYRPPFCITVRLTIVRLGCGPRADLRCSA